MPDRLVIYVVLGRSSRAKASKARLTQEQKVMLYGVLAMIALYVMIGIVLTSR